MFNTQNSVVDCGKEKKLRVLLKSSNLIFEELVAVSREETEPKNQRGQQNKTKTNMVKPLKPLTVGENSQSTDLLFGFFCFISAGHDCTSVPYNGKSSVQPFDLHSVFVQSHKTLSNFLVWKRSGNFQISLCH